MVHFAVALQGTTGPCSCACACASLGCYHVTFACGCMYYTRIVLSVCSCPLSFAALRVGRPVICSWNVAGGEPMLEVRVITLQ